MPKRTSITESLALLRSSRAGAVQRLAAALISGLDNEIVAAAREVRRLGAHAPDVDWTTVCEAEQRASTVATLVSALNGRDDQRAAAAWSKLTACWSYTQHESVAMAGKAAFRRRGHVLRQAERVEQQHT